MDDITVLEPTVTAEEVYESMATTDPAPADFSQHRDCGHWRS